MLCFLNQGKKQQREMSEPPSVCLPHGMQSQLKPRGVVHRGPGLERLHGGYPHTWPSRTASSPPTPKTKVCLVQMVLLAVSPLQVQTRRSFGQRHLCFSCWTTSSAVCAFSEVKAKGRRQKPLLFIQTF